MPLIIFLLLFTLSCNSSEPVPQVAASARPFPGAPLYPAHMLDGLKSTDDLFVFDRIVSLETTDISVVGLISDLLYLDDQWIVADSSTQGIYRFSKEGYFLGIVGNQGSGPGEYSRLGRLQACYDNTIGVFDRGTSKVLLYDISGTFLRSIPLIGKRALIPGGRFIWNERDRLVISSVNEHADRNSRHLCLDVSRPEPVPLFGFGKRNRALDLARPKGSGNFYFDMFAKIGDRIWAGPPLSTEINVYEINGAFAGRLGGKIPRDPSIFITADDYKDLYAQKNIRAYLNEHVFSKYKNFFLFRVENLVCVIVGQTMDIYDVNGNLMVHSLRIGNLVPMWGFGDQAVHYLPAFNPDKIRDDLREAAQNALFEVSEDSNPILMTYRLNPDIFK